MIIHDQKSIILKAPRRPSCDFYPDVLSIFKLARKRLEPNFSISLMISDSGEFFAQAINRRGNTPYTIQIADFLPDMLNKDEILFVLGHETGHLFFFNPTLPANKDNDHVKILPDRGSCPLPIWRMVCDTYQELWADFYGIKACGEVDIALNAYSKISGKSEKNDHRHIVTYSSLEETRILIKALKLLKRSSLQYEILDQPLFQAGKYLLSEETFNSKVRELFVPWMAITAEEFNALEECACAAIYVLLASSESSEQVSIPGSVESHMKKYTCRPELLLSFTSIDKAYTRMEELSPAIRNLNHFMRHRHFEFISSLAFKMEDDPYVSEDFVRHVGTYMGMTPAETRQYLDEFQNLSALEKAS